MKAESSLVPPEPAIVSVAEDVVEVFVMNHRLDEPDRDGGGVEIGMNGDRLQVGIVRAEADRSTAGATGAAPPSDRDRNDIPKILTTNLFRDRLEVIVSGVGLQLEDALVRLGHNGILGEGEP